MNIFEGARRVAIVLGAVGAFGGFAAALQQDADVSYNYRIAYHDAPAIKTADKCNTFSDDAWKVLEYSNDDGSKFSATLCFSASLANNGQMLVPYTEQNGQTLMGGKYTPQVQDYINKYAVSTFKLTQADFDRAKAEYASQKLRKKAYMAGYVVGALIIYWIIISAIGWIVRGFFGIPNGADRRVTPASPATQP